MPQAARRTVLLLLVAALLALPGVASAAGPQSPRSLQSSVLDLWSHLWSFFTKEGCGLDPGGRCLPPKEGCTIDPSGAKEGCIIDPDGAKGGCVIDPNGKPACGPTPAAPTSNADGGCGLDPDGKPCGGRQ